MDTKNYYFHDFQGDAVKRFNEHNKIEESLESTNRYYDHIRLIKYGGNRKLSPSSVFLTFTFLN